MTFRLALLAVFTLLSPGILLNPKVAAAERLACPELITVQENIKDSLEGWFPQEEEVPHRLMRVGFFDGNPKEKAELAPEKEFRKKGKLNTSWRFGTTTAQNLWISCSYGRTAMAVVQPLKKSYKSCMVVTDPAVTIDGQPSVVSIECK